MPKLTIQLILNGGRERRVNPLAHRQIGCLMHSRTNERMPEPDLRSFNLDQLGCDRRRQGVDAYPLTQHRFACAQGFVE